MAADIYSSILGLLLMGTGNDNNTWGANANTAVFTVLEDAIANTLTSVVTGGTLDLSGSPPPAAASQARYAIMAFSGTLTANQTVKVPNLSKMWLVHNGTSGAFTLQFKTPNGTASAAIPAGFAFVYCDGADGIFVGLSTSLRDVQWLGADGTAAAPGVAFTNEAGSGIYRKSAGVLGISILGTEILEISATAVNVIGSGVSLQIAGAQVPPSGAEQPYAGINLPAGGWLWEDGAAYSRPIANGGSVDTYKNLFNALTTTVVGNTNSTTAITGLANDMRGKGLNVAKVEGTGIPSGTTITFTGATTATLSQAATSSTTGLTLRILPWGQGDGSTTFNVPDRRYRALVGRDDMNNNAAGRSSAFAGIDLTTTGGEESHTLSQAEMPSHTHTATVTDTTAYSFLGAQSSSQSGNGVRTMMDNGSGGSFTVTPTKSGSVSVSNSSTGSGSAHNNMQPFGITNYIIKI